MLGIEADITQAELDDGYIDIGPIDPNNLTDEEAIRRLRRLSDEEGGIIHTKMAAEAIYRLHRKKEAKPVIAFVATIGDWHSGGMSPGENENEKAGETK
jgi:hypothetical protein